MLYSVVRSPEGASLASPRWSDTRKATVAPPWEGRPYRGFDPLRRTLLTVQCVESIATTKSLVRMNKAASSRFQAILLPPIVARAVGDCWQGYATGREVVEYADRFVPQG